MTKQQKANKILKLLHSKYPQVEPPLKHFSNLHELLFAVMLTAQANDNAVNKVTPELFQTYPKLADYAAATPADIAAIIRSIGLYNSKAKKIVAAAQKLIQDYNSQVPSSPEELTTLPGVGRKTAVVVLHQGFHKNIGIATDTHVQRLARWFGLSEHKNPLKIEQDLMTLFPQEEWGDLSLRFIFLGREVLTARNPKYAGTEWEQFLV